ncbi:hypothetical protein HELRODRAFT_110282 [Helobdella robusta]|uniref:Amine oxidase domain-containing protein n=1 Tax=Helobdella robusta TaxID=6412 RepID=T1EF10_HELRO|nr:hypothetical protein HELRODRAFT_110282 [Helobdella robusta]ESO08037.1 hypothetical protein HELRODRAFT_110282 [Helobdella robusta]
MSIILDIANYFVEHPILMVLMFLIYLILFGISVVLFGQAPKPNSNPFCFDATKRPEPLVISQAERNKVLKQGFSEKNIPDNIDAIIIGSGIGALTTGALLSKVGKRVLVLEQHDQAGGCCHTFIEKEFEFDVGIHYVGEMKSRTIVKFLLDQVSQGQIVWDHLDSDFDMVVLSNKMDPEKTKFIPIRGMGYGPFKKKLLEYFPDEEEALDKYIQLLKSSRSISRSLVYYKIFPKWLVKILVWTRLMSLISSYHKYASKTVADVLHGLTKNVELKTVLSYNFFDYGVEPTRSSFAIHSALMNHFINGGSYPRGGSSEIAFHIIPVIEKSGGSVLVRAKVSEILVEDGAVVGVRVRRAGGGHVDIASNVVISDAGVVNTFAKMLPETIAEKTSIYKIIKNSQVEPGTLSCMSLFVGLNGTAEELKLPNYNIWCFNCTDACKAITDYAKLTLDEALNSDIPFAFIVSPSAKDSSYQLRHPGKSTLTIISTCMWDWFKDWDKERVKKRGSEYEDIKKQFMDKMWAIVLKFYPHLEDKVEYMDLGTSVTNNFYLGTVVGEVYALDHTIRRFNDQEVLMHLRPQTDIKGLFLTGQDTICCGFVTGLYSGLLTASAVLKRNLFRDMLALLKKVNEKDKLYTKSK